MHFKSFRRRAATMAATLALFALFAMPAAPAFAALFDIDILISNGGGDGDDGDLRRMFSFDTVEDLLESVELSDLEETFQGRYMDEMADMPSTVMATINYRGVLTELNFPNAAMAEMGRNENTVVFKVPRLNINVAFTGESRDASLDMLGDFLEGDGVSIINRINKLLVAESAVDPVAGNPNSLQTTMADRAFTTATETGPAIPRATNQGSTSQGGAAPPKQDGGGLFAMGARFGRYNQGDSKISAWTLPFGYSFETETGKEFEINFPLTYVKTEGASSYKVGFDFTYKHPFTEKWSLSPTLGYGLVGSADLVSSAQMGSFALTSVYQFYQSAGGWQFHIANMGGVYKTFPIKLEGVKVDPDVTNHIAKNGLILRANRNVLNRPALVEFYLTDMRFFGDELYSERYNEIGVHLKPQNRRGLRKYLGLNATYLTGENDVDGFKLSLSYRF